MKKYTKIAYVCIAFFILLCGFFIYKVSGNNNTDRDIKEKSLSEVKYLESKLFNLFNQLNNISFENYKISATEIKKQETEQKSSNSSSSGGDSSQSKKSGGSSNSGSSGEIEESSSENNKKYKLEETGILTKDSEINWNQIKNEVENIYVLLYPTTLDLYQTDINKDDIVNFNKEYDNLTMAVKNENKDETLKVLSKLYDYLPRFIEKCAIEEKDKTLVKTKNNIFKAYSILEKEDWEMISKCVNNSITEYTKIVTDVANQQKGNQYNINKAYIILNELQNAVALNDKEVFLIKYKNLLEELQNI